MKGGIPNRGDREDAKDHIKQHEGSDEKSVCVLKKGMSKLKQSGKAAKMLLLLLLKPKLKSVISDGNCKLGIFFVLKILIVVFLVVSSQ